MARNTLEHRPQDQEDYPDEQEKPKKNAFENYCDNLNERNSELVADLNTAATHAKHHTDKSQLSWVKNNGFQNSVEIYDTVKDALLHSPAHEREQLIESTVHALMKPTTDHPDPLKSYETTETQTTHKMMAAALLTGDFDDFRRGYREMYRLQQLHDQAVRDNPPGYRDLLKEQTTPEEAPLTYRELLKEPAADHPEETTPLTYRELLKEPAADHQENHAQDHTKSPIEHWIEQNPNDSLATHMEHAEEQLRILSAEPKTALTFIRGIREQLTGSFQMENGYDLTDDERTQTTHTFMQNLRNNHPDLMVAIAKGEFPDMDGWRNFSFTDDRETANYPQSEKDNKVLYDVLQQTLDGLNYPEDQSKSDHLRHTVTQLLTKPTDEVLANYKEFHRGWKPKSHEQEIIGTTTLTIEAARLEHAPADIGWGEDRQNHPEIWKKIRDDLFQKEMEVRDLATQYRWDGHPQDGVHFFDPKDPILLQNRAATDEALLYSTPYMPNNEHHEPLIKKLARNPADAFRVFKDHLDPEIRHQDDLNYQREAAYTMEQEIMPRFIQKLRENYPEILTDLASREFETRETPESQSAIFKTMIDVLPDMTSEQQEHLGWVIGHLAMRQPYVWNAVHNLRDARDYGDNDFDDQSQDQRLNVIAQNLEAQDWKGHESIRDRLLKETRDHKDLLEEARHVPISI